MEKTVKKSKKNKLLILYIFVAIILFIIGFYGFFSVLNRDTIHDEIKIEKFNVSNMTKKDALNYIKQEVEEDLKHKQMTLSFKDKNYTVKLKDLGFYYDYEKAVNEAYSIGRNGNVFSRLKNIIKTRKHGKKVNLKSGYDTKLIDELVDKISKEINVNSKNSVFHFNGGRMYATSEVVGRKVNEELLREKIKDNIYKLEDIEIPVKKLEPKVTKAQLSRINGVIGQYSTSFKTSGSDRKENIRIATNTINGKIIMPGEIFSFNQSTGPRSKDNGYKQANIIVDGKYIKGFGGGVCQVSTTLYNAILSAGLQIVERHPHSIPASYVPNDKDAAVSYGALDLKFKNNFDFPIYLDTGVSKDTIFISIYGDKNAKK